jgi:hypothetical protein
LGNGVTTNFAYGYRIFEDADLTVTVDGVIQTLTTDYTVNGAGDDSGGTIDFITAPINLSVVTLSGELAYDRTTDYIQNGGMRADTFDNDHDKSTMQIQQLRRDIKRSIKVPIEETTDQEVSFTPANRADKILAFDAAGLPVAASITDLSSILTTVDTSLALSSEVLSVVIPNRQAVAGGTVDAITAIFVPTIAALANNIEVMVEASGANTSTTPTFEPDGLIAKTMVKGSNQALIPGDVPGANFRMHLVFDATLDKWVLLNPVNPSALAAGTAALPVVGWINTGFYESAADEIGVSCNGAIRWNFSATSFTAADTNGPALQNEASSVINPTLCPDKADVTAGWGGTSGNLSGIIGGAEIVRVVASGLTVQVAAASPPAINTLSKDNIVKAWVNFDETGSINDSFNVSSINDDATGRWTVNWDTDFANANYGAWGTAVPEDSSDGYMHIVKAGTYAVGAIQMELRNSGGTLIDGSVMNVFAMGDQ